MYSFTRWSDQFGDAVAKLREERTGNPNLVYVGEFNEDWLQTLWRAGVKPSEAARVLDALWQARDIETFVGVAS